MDNFVRDEKRPKRKRPVEDAKKRIKRRRPQPPWREEKALRDVI